MLTKSLALNIHNREKRDQIFNLPLQTLVEGQDAYGKDFRERTVLFYINHQGATFNLMNPIILGSKLRLVVDLPPTLAEDKNLKLVIRGKVALVEGIKGYPAKQRVSVRFENKYFIKEDG